MILFELFLTFEKEVINETDSGVGADLDKVSVVALKEDVEEKDE